MFTFGLIFGLACSQKEDGELYRLALEQTNPSVCLELSNVELQGDCITAVVSENPNRVENERLCNEIVSEKWKGECYFQLSDSGQFIGSQAIQLCSKAGPFSEDCLRHAAARDVELNVHLADLKQAKSLLPRIYGIVKQYLMDSIAQPMARDMLVRMVATHLPSEPFSARFCDGLSPDTCTQIYIVRSLGSGDQGDKSWASACEVPLSARTAVELGLADYTKKMQSVVDRAWGQMCQTSR